ncbi:glyoxalase-like domain-containing protein [Variovorax paradoxus B4]|uniref:Glyoxalase-like domain protein n=2 Tax=Variovorax paradoxus TaxID=34073 RepID=A0A0H2LQ58_VARPD|nr:VOC family protein [Variovorax paradoxus]AGU51185.1 glyoxalase-like domain-containing protein [Variovorax paradoxus B4]KLN52443.1 glyoxalase-like domain protein [Variovorax paradoxus]
MKLWFNLLCRDIESQMRFYAALLGWPEAVHSRSPIYRALQHEGVQFGFNAPPAYALLGLDERAPGTGAETVPPVTAYATFMLDTPSAVDAASAQAAALGGRVLKAPYATYYGQWQAVLADPEQHVFRVSSHTLPPGA